MACGTGKTLVAMWVGEALECRRVVVFVPSLSLLAQTLREWCDNAAGDFAYMPVCSDETVGGDDQILGAVSDLGLPASTDPDAVAAFLKQPGRRVLFATYQSSSVVAAALGRADASLDLLIADEAHRCVGRMAGPFA